jgi:type IV pilus biogenesis protein PilP
MRFANIAFLAAIVASPLMAQSPPASDATAPPPAADAPASDTAVIPARVEGVATVGDLARVMSQRLLAEERKKLIDAQRSTSSDAAPADAGSGTAPAAGQGGTSRRAYESPVVVGIHGSASAPYALVRVSDATVLSVRAGDSLPGGLRVERVAPQGVTVRDAAGARTLGFSAAVDQPAANAGAQRR